MGNETRDAVSLPFEDDGHAQCVALTFIYQPSSKAAYPAAVRYVGSLESFQQAQDLRGSKQVTLHHKPRRTER